MPRVSLLLFLALLLVPRVCLAANVGRSIDPVDSLELTVSLEDSVYLEYQSVPIIICASNRGSRTLGAITQPGALTGYKVLTNVISGGTIHPRYYEDGFEFGAWDLKPGQSICVEQHLDGEFGSGTSGYGETSTLRRGLGGTHFEPGRYRLAMIQWCRLPQDPWHRHITLRAVVEFRVDSLASSPADLALAAAFDKAGPFPTNATEEMRNLCVTWLPRFYDSSFFDHIYWRARSRIPPPPPDSLFLDLNALEKRPFRRACIAWTYLQSANRGRHAGGKEIDIPRLRDDLREYLKEEPGPEILSSFTLGPMREIRSR